MYKALAAGLMTLGALAGTSSATAGRVLPAARAPAEQAEQVAAAVKAAAVAHIELQRSLEALVAAKPQVLQLIDSGDLEGFRSQAVRIQDALAAARIAMDRAVLNGAWKTPQNKRRAADLADSLQGAQTLSLMTVAISTGYEYPTKKVPDAAADAAVRLFDRIAQLAADVKALNGQAG